jgi:hypothetical protein
MASPTAPFLRLVRPTPEPLGLYIRVGRNDHKELLSILNSGGNAFFGIVLDPTLHKRQAELRETVLQKGFDVVLDPRSQELATIGGFTGSLAELPWAASQSDKVTDFSALRAEQFATSLAEFVVAGKYTAVLSPTHFLNSSSDRWLGVDVKLTSKLRRALDDMGAFDVQIFYSLALRYSTFRNAQERREIRDALKDIPADGIWLKIDGLGAESSAAAVRNYITGASDFHELGLPLVTDMVGGMPALSMLAFGAAGGVCHGLTLRERFDASSWFKPRDPNSHGFQPSPRVYIQELGLLLKRQQADVLFSAHRAKSRFGCKHSDCCPNGPKDTIANPLRHFFFRRTTEVHQLGLVPAALRPERFLEDMLRPATDAAVFAERLNLADSVLAQALRKKKKSLETLRVTLGDMTKDRPGSHSSIPVRRAARTTTRHPSSKKGQ